MAKRKTCTAEFIEWMGGEGSETATEEYVEELEKKTSKSFWKWLLISLIPGVSFFTMGFAVFCYNNLSYIKSRGRNTGNNIVRLVMLLYGLLFIPLLEVNICSKNDKLGNKILGWDK